MVKNLKSPKDLRTLIFIAVGIAVQLYCFFVFKLEIAGFIYFFIFTSVSFWAASANHMHQHHPIFYSPYLNQLVSLSYSFMFGAPATRLHAVHLWNHHAHFNSELGPEADWSHHQLAGLGSGLMRTIEYNFKSTRLMWKNRVLLNLPKDIQRSLALERGFVWLLSIILLYLNPLGFIFLVLPSWILGLGMLLTANLINHDGCETESDSFHSRDFTHRLENWIFLNSGYHSAHHLMPGAHWSELPSIHRRNFFEKRKFVENSFFGYFFKFYILPLKRDQERNI